MLMNMKDLLSVAQQHKFGIGAFNIASAEFARAVIEVAEKLRSPVILEIHPDEHDFTGDDFIFYLRELAIKATVPVVIHGSWTDSGAGYAGDSHRLYLGDD